MFTHISVFKSVLSAFCLVESDTTSWGAHVLLQDLCSALPTPSPAVLQEGQGIAWGQVVASCAYGLCSHGYQNDAFPSKKQPDDSASIPFACLYTAVLVRTCLWVIHLPSLEGVILKRTVTHGLIQTKKIYPEITRADVEILFLRAQVFNVFDGMLLLLESCL